MQPNQHLLWLLGNSLAYRKYAFPLYWVLIVVLPQDNDAMPFFTWNKAVRDREENRERRAAWRGGTDEMNKVYPCSCALAEEG